MEVQRGAEVLREGASLRGRDIIPELLLLDDPAPASYNRFHTTVPLETMSDQTISKRIELLTGYSRERLQELIPGGTRLEGHKLYMLAHLLIAKANRNSEGQRAISTGVPTMPGFNLLKPLLSIALFGIISALFLGTIWQPGSSVPGNIDDTIVTNHSVVAPLTPTLPPPPKPPTKLEIFEARYLNLTKLFPQQSEVDFETLKTKLTPIVNEPGSALLGITGTGPTARAIAEAIPWVLSETFISVNPLQFGSLATDDQRNVISDIMRAWSDRPDDVMIIHELDKLPTDVFNVIVEVCSTAMKKNGVLIASGDRLALDRLSACGEVTTLEVTREVGIGQQPDIYSGDFESSISPLKRTFPLQSDRLWQVSGFVIEEHLQDRDPGQPAMLILAGLPGANRTVNHLAEGLARIYTDNPLVINSRQFHRVDPARAKLHLDRALDSAFRGGRRAAVLTELDTLPPASAMMLHSYCDHDNAQYKDVAYFMTLQLRESIDPSVPVAQQDRAVRDHLREAWAALGEEKRDPLNSRIATMIVLVQREGSFDRLSEI